jgi:hypothetical protein
MWKTRFVASALIPVIVAMPILAGPRGGFGGGFRPSPSVSRPAPAVVRNPVPNPGQTMGGTEYRHPVVQTPVPQSPAGIRQVVPSNRLSNVGGSSVVGSKGLGEKPVVAISSGRGKVTNTSSVTNNKQAVSESSRGGKGAPTANRKPLSADLRSITNSQRITDEFLISSGKLSPAAANALQKALDGKQLSQAELKTLGNEEKNNPILTPSQKAGLSAVQADQRQQLRDRATAKLAALASLAAGAAGADGPGFSDPPAVGTPVIPSDPAVADPATATAGDGVPAVSRASALEPVAGQQIGMKIIRVLTGGAGEAADLRADDVLYQVAGQRVRNYEEFHAAIEQAKGSVEIVFFNAETRRYEKLDATPQDGLLGVEVIETELPQ